MFFIKIMKQPSTPEILLLTDEHETDIHPDCGDKESVDEQIGH